MNRRARTGADPMTEREMVIALAEKVMGWRIHCRNTAHWVEAAQASGTYPSPRVSVGSWNPLTSISDAWMVVEAMREKGWLVVVKGMPADHSFILEGSRSEYDAPHPDREIGKGKWACESKWMGEGFRHDEWILASTAPRAISLAALEAMGVEV